jgi:hypothetical protein
VNAVGAFEGVSVTISQPRYLPALNYVQRVCYSDIFIVLDTVQRQARAFENRNRLLLPGPHWLTIPIQSSSRAQIADTVINGESWIASHRAQIIGNYRRARHFDGDLLDLYLSPYQAAYFDQAANFSKATVRALALVLDELGLPYQFRFASDLDDAVIRSASGPDKLRSLCEKVGASVYVSGENGRSYGVAESFSGGACKPLFHQNINLSYPQPGQPAGFVPYMGFLDPLFNCGRDWFSDAVLKPLLLVS